MGVCAERGCGGEVKQVRAMRSHVREQERFYIGYSGVSQLPSLQPALSGFPPGASLREARAWLLEVSLRIHEGPGCCSAPGNGGEQGEASPACVRRRGGRSSSGRQARVNQRLASQYH